MKLALISSSNKTYLAYFLLTFTALFWSSNIVVGKYLNTDISPLTLAFWRWFVATLILVPLTFSYLRNDWQRIVKQWKLMVFLSLLGVSLFNTILYYSTQSTDATNIALIQTSMPLMVVVISFVLFSQKISIGTFIGLLFGIMGAMIVIFKGSFSLSFSTSNFTNTVSIGDVSMLLAVFIYALYSVLLVKVQKIHQYSLLLVTFMIGTLLLTPFFLWEQFSSGTFIPDTSSTLLILYLAIFPSILAYLFWNFGVAEIGSHTTGLFICFIPVFTPMIAAIFLNEILYFYHYLGILMIILSVGIVHWSKKPMSQK